MLVWCRNMGVTVKPTIIDRAPQQSARVRSSAIAMPATFASLKLSYVYVKSGSFFTTGSEESSNVAPIVEVKRAG
jgi:hypothetical protein